MSVQSSPTKRTYKVVDVFAAVPLLGNPVGVVLDAQGLDTPTMQAIAGWTNLSETTFLLPPEDSKADYRLRIFTPRREIPFAGHPTLGSAHAAIEAGRITPRDGQLVQECGLGLVPINVHGSGPDRHITLTLPPTERTPMSASDIAEMEAIIGFPVVRDAPATIIDVGPRWAVAQLQSADELIALEPDYSRLAALSDRFEITGLTLFAPHSAGEAQIEVRSFAPSVGVNEDPVCGSGNGAVAAFRHMHGLLPSGETQYIATQGQRVGRAGRITVRVTGSGEVYLGGQCVSTVEGTLIR